MGAWDWGHGVAAFTRGTITRGTITEGVDTVEGGELALTGMGDGTADIPDETAVTVRRTDGTFPLSDEAVDLTDGDLGNSGKYIMMGGGMSLTFPDDPVDTVDATEADDRVDPVEPIDGDLTGDGDGTLSLTSSSMMGLRYAPATMAMVPNM